MFMKSLVTLTFTSLILFGGSAHAADEEMEALDSTYPQAIAKLKDKSFSDAAELFRVGAEKGHRDSQYYLGLMYAKGDGIEQSYSQAHQWLEKAAMNGYPKAMYHLGEMYVWGDGVDVDYEQAAVWFWLATGFGDKYAQKRLRTMATRINSAQLANAEAEMKRLWEKMPHDLVQKKKSLH